MAKAASTRTENTADPSSAAPSVAGPGDRLARGTVAGLFAGIVFLIAQMGWAVQRLDLPAVAPLLDISTIFNGIDTMPMVTPDNLLIGLVTHLTLTMLFGIGFAFIAAFLRSPLILAAGGLAFGVVLYVVNIQILGRVAFEWFTDPKGPPQGFELVIHAVYGLLLVPFFIGAALRWDRSHA